MEDFMRELKEQPIWVCWNLAIDGQGRRTKVPKAANGCPTGTSDKWSNTWVTYDEAVKGKEEHGYSGVSFRIPENGFFLDVDGRQPDDPLVQTLLSRFDCYAERSVSGHGIHIYGYCEPSRLPIEIDPDSGKMKLSKEFYCKNPHNQLELYCGYLTNRFAAFTGDVICEKPLKVCTEAVLTTLDKDMRRRKPGRPKSKLIPVTDDEDGAVFNIVASLRRQKNAEKFSTLYDAGDFSEYNSQSEADAALCAIIAFRAGPDPETIDRVFRSSALYREKWNRQDYRESTIAQGIEACRGVFHRSKMEHPSFIKFNLETGVPYVSVPLLARYFRDTVDYLIVRDNGKQGVLKYVYEHGVYSLYSDDMMMGVIKSLIEEYDPELVKMSQVRETLSHILTDMHYVGIEELDADPHIINVQNGLLRYADGEWSLIPHTPDIYSTVQLKVNWMGRPTPTPHFDAYMDTLTDSRHDKLLLDLQLMAVTCSNIPAWYMKKAPFFVGPGDSGKTVLLRLLCMFIGSENFAAIDLKDLEARFGTGVIYGTRLAGSSDMSYVSVDELKTFKCLTGGDSVFAEFKGQNGFKFVYKGMLWFCMNRLPKFGGDNGKWVYDRIMVISCPNVIPKEKQDKMLLEKLYAERDGIFYQMVMALTEVIGNGYRYTEPDSVTTAREEYRNTNSTVISFFSECMCEWPQGKINRHCTTGRVYKVYAAWCKENNRGYAKTAREFREELAEFLGSHHLDLITRRKGNSYYKKYGLTEEAKEQYMKEYGYDETPF